MASGNPARPYGINAEGLARRGFDPGAIAALKRAYRSVYRASLTLEEARKALEEQVQIHPEVALLVEFLAAEGRGIIR
jgi:UDP-N-acetylglucosamine acyltransferase